MGRDAERAETGRDESGRPEDGQEWRTRLTEAAHRLAAEPSFAEATALYREGRAAPAEIEGLIPLRVGVLRNVTIEPWLPDLFAALLRRGMLAKLWVGDFGVVEPYAAGSELAERELDILLVHLDARALAGDARHLPPPDLRDALERRFDGLVEGLKGATAARLVLSNLGPDALPLHAPYADQDPASWPGVRRAVNTFLVERFAADPRVALVDVDRLIAEFGAGSAYDRRMYATARNPFSVSFLPHLADAFASVVAADRLPPKKCVVVDCDNTLWGGVLGEDGPSGIALGDDYPGSAYREFHLFLKGLASRGFLLAIDSKNNESDVLDFFRESRETVLRLEDFVAHRINWADKVTNLRELADELNLGLDSFVFIDDSPVECDWVRSSLPEVQVELFPSDPMEIEPFFSSIPNLERLAVTPDDLVRAESMRANAARERLRGETPDLDSFLRSLRIELTIHKQDRDAVPRVSQLTQRTNQFNLTTRRYTVEEVERWLDEGRVYTMRMRDRFSDYGVIAVAIVGQTGEGTWDVDSFLMSCRAFGRGIEAELLAAVLDDLRAGSAHEVTACYLPTAKNPMTRDFFVEQGFHVTEDSEEVRRFARSLTEGEARAGSDVYRIERIGF